MKNAGHNLKDLNTANDIYSTLNWSSSMLQTERNND